MDIVDAFKNAFNAGAQGGGDAGAQGGGDTGAQGGGDTGAQGGGDTGAQGGGDTGAQGGGDADAQGGGDAGAQGGGDAGAQGGGDADAQGGGDTGAQGGGDAGAQGGGDADAQGGGDADAQGGELTMEKVSSFLSERGIDLEALSNAAEILKDPRVELLRQDDGVKKIVDAYTSGKLEEYLSLASIDPDNLTPEQLLDMKLRQEYPSLSNKAFEKIRNKALEKYGFSDDDDDANEVAMELLKADMDKYRAEIKDKKENFSIPEYTGQSNSSNQQDNNGGVQINEEEIEKFNNFVANHPATKQIAEGSLQIKIGDMPINIKVDSSLSDYAYDLSKMFSKLSDGKGGIDLERFYVMAAIVENMDEVFSTIVDTARSLERQKIIDDAAGGSPSAEPRSGGSQQKTTLGQALLKGLGKI